MRQKAVGPSQYTDGLGETLNYLGEILNQNLKFRMVSTIGE